MSIANLHYHPWLIGSPSKSSFFFFYPYLSFKYGVNANVIPSDLILNYIFCVIARSQRYQCERHTAASIKRLCYSFSLKLLYSSFTASCTPLQALNLSRPVGRTDFLPEFHLSKEAQYSVHQTMSVRVNGKTTATVLHQLKAKLR